MSRYRITAALGLLLLIVIAGCSSPNQQPSPAPTSYGWKVPEPPTPSYSPRPTPLPTLDSQVWASWAFLDRARGVVTELGGNGQGTSTTESMIKVALAAQYLRDLEARSQQATDDEMHMLSIMIRDSDNDAAETLYRRGGRDQMLQSAIATCGLLNTTTKPGWWSETQMTPGDAARLGACIANGKLCSAEWATWILGEMRSVRGVGRFGIIDSHPTDGGRPLAIKNGYQIRDDGWHVNCLAIADGWTMAVMLRYPTGRDMAYGATLCAAVAASLAPPDPAAIITPSGVPV